MKNKYFKNYYLVKFGQIMAIVFFIFFILSGVWIYFINLNILNFLKETNQQLVPTVIYYLFLASTSFSLIIAILFGGLITLMLYAQKEKKNNIKYILLGLSILIGIFLILAYSNII